MAGEKYAVDGAKIFCTGCAVSSEIKALNNQTVKVQTKNVCNELDKQPTNIKFSTCSFVKTCQPKLTVWNNPSSRTTASKSKALLDDASIPCLAGGVVSFVVPENVGQNSESISAAIKLSTSWSKAQMENLLLKLTNLPSEIENLSNQLGKAQEAAGEAARKLREATDDLYNADERWGKGNAIGVRDVAKAEYDAAEKVVGEIAESIKSSKELFEDSISKLKKAGLLKHTLEGTDSVLDIKDLLSAKGDKEKMKIILASVGAAGAVASLPITAGWVVCGGVAIVASFAIKKGFDLGMNFLEQKNVKFGNSEWNEEAEKAENRN